MAKALLNLLDKYEITERIWGIVGDNAKNNDTLCQKMYEIRSVFKVFRGTQSYVHCFVHIIQLRARAILKPFEGQGAPIEDQIKDLEAVRAFDAVTTCNISDDSELELLDDGTQHLSDDSDIENVHRTEEEVDEIIGNSERSNNKSLDPAFEEEQLKSASALISNVSYHILVLNSFY